MRVLRSSLNDRTASLAVLAVALALGAFARFNIVRGDFPYNDGAMFLEMTWNLQDAHYALPEFTTYNQRQIPFAYPPFGFYFLGIASDVTGIDELDLMRVLPVYFNILAIGATYVLARHFLKSWTAAAIAALIFALIPNSFEWNIMGGGLTRSPGYLFAILTVDQAYRMYTTKKRRYIATSALLGALSILSHAQMGQFALIGAGLAFVFYGLNATGLLYSVFVGIGVLALVLPWFLTVVSRHGLTPFQQAVSTASPEAAGLDFSLSTRLDILMHPISRYSNIIPILGLFKLAFDRRWFIPAWFLANNLLAPRGAPSRAGVIVAIASAAALCEFLYPLLVGLAQRLRSVSAAREATAPATEPVEAAASEPVVMTEPAVSADAETLTLRLPPWWKPALVSALAIIATVIVVTSPRNFTMLPERYRFYSLPPAERAAMEWMSEFTLPTCTVVSVTLGPWGRDTVAEWLPTLTERMSPTTVQGTEWLTGTDQFYTQAWRARLNACGESDAACVQAWRDRSGIPFTHLYIEAPVRASFARPLRESLAQSPDYSLVYNEQGTMIFARRDTPCAPVE